MNNITTTKAVRAIIHLGTIPLSVYQLPDGSYRLAGRNVTDAVEEPNNSLTRALKARSLKDLPGADSSLIQIKAETGETFVPVAINDAIQYWGIMAKAGNQQATNILMACAIEAIERRADAVFGKQRTEEERQARMEDRINGKLVRRQFTDAIKDYLDRNAITGNRAQWMYVHASDTLNRLLFGLTAKKLCEKYKCPKEALRNQFSREDIVNIRRMEEHSMRLVDRNNVDPIDALGEAYRFWFAN